MKPFKIHYKDENNKPIDLHDLLQSIFQDEPKLREYKIVNVLKATLIIMPGDKQGKPVTPTDANGTEVFELHGSKAYRSFADHYDQQFEIEAKPVEGKSKSGSQSSGLFGRGTTLPFASM